MCKFNSQCLISSSASLSVRVAGIKKKRETELTYSICVTLGYFYKGLIYKGVGSVLGKPQASHCLKARTSGPPYIHLTERVREVTPNLEEEQSFKSCLIGATTLCGGMQPAGYGNTWRKPGGSTTQLHSLFCL